MLTTIIILLFFIALLGTIQVLQGAHLMAAIDEILAAQGQITASLAAIAAQQAGSATPAQLAQVLANEQANAAAAQALVIPPAP